MTANSQRLRELADAIELKANTPGNKLPLAKPVPNFMMSRWATSCDKRTNKPEDINICNTAGCLAGTAVALYEPDDYKRLVWEGRVGYIKPRATYLLGLSFLQAASLFTPVEAIADVQYITTEQAVIMLRWLADNPGANQGEIDQRWLDMYNRRVK